MPKVSYLNSSIAIKYANVFQKYANSKMPDNLEKEIKNLVAIRKELKKYRDKKIKIEIKLNEAEKPGSDFDEKDIKKLENENAYLSEKINSLSIKENNYMTEHPNINKYGHLFTARKYKSKINAIKKKETITSADGASLRNILNDVKEIIDPKNPDLINGSYETGKQAGILFNHMVKKDLYKLKNINQSEKIQSLEGYMEYQGLFMAETHIHNVYKGFKIFEKRLLDLDNNNHINSREFKAMKKAVNNIVKELSKDEINKVELGNKLEILQRAAVNYINEKGIGGQYTDLGKNRLDFALEVANFSFVCGEGYPSLDSYERFYDTKYKSDFPAYDSGKQEFLNEKMKANAVIPPEKKAEIDDNVAKYEIKYNDRIAENKTEVNLPDDTNKGKEKEEVAEIG